MRLLLDTNVVVSGMLWSGAPKQLLEAARARDFVLVSSAAMLAELAEVLGRPKFGERVAITGSRTGQLISGFAALAVLVRPAQLGRVAPDEQDDKVLATALAGSADAIITGDEALLRMNQFRGIEFWRAQEAMIALRNG